MKELSLKAPLATASKGAGTLTVTPTAVDEDVSFNLVVPWSRQATFTATDFLGETASCTVTLRVTADGELENNSAGFLFPPNVRLILVVCRAIRIVSYKCILFV